MSSPSCAQHWTCTARSLIEMTANFLQRGGPADIYGQITFEIR
jgi:hypothetical protein